MTPSLNFNKISKYGVLLDKRTLTKFVLKVGFAEIVVAKDDISDITCWLRPKNYNRNFSKLARQGPI
jgi:hypothetical protein